MSVGDQRQRMRLVHWRSSVMDRSVERRGIHSCQHAPDKSEGLKVRSGHSHITARLHGAPIYGYRLSRQVAALFAILIPAAITTPTFGPVSSLREDNLDEPATILPYQEQYRLSSETCPASILCCELGLAAEHFGVRRAQDLEARSVPGVMWTCRTLDAVRSQQ